MARLIAEARALPGIYDFIIIASVTGENGEPTADLKAHNFTIHHLGCEYDASYPYPTGADTRSISTLYEYGKGFYLIVLDPKPAEQVLGQHVFGVDVASEARPGGQPDTGKALAYGFAKPPPVPMEYSRTDAVPWTDLQNKITDRANQGWEFVQVIEKDSTHTYLLVRRPK